MFQHTLARAARLTPWERVIVVAAQHHQHEVWFQDQAVRGSNVLGGRPVLLAARSDGLELEYGWIKPGRFLGRTG